MKPEDPPKDSETDEARVATVEDVRGAIATVVGNPQMVRRLLHSLEAAPEPESPPPLLKGRFVDMLENSLARPRAIERHPGLVPLLRANQLWSAMRSESPAVRGRAWAIYDELEVFLGERAGDAEGADAWRRWYDPPVSSGDLRVRFGDDAPFIEELAPVVPYMLMFDFIGHSDRFAAAEKEELLESLWLELAVLLEVQHPSKSLQSTYYVDLLKRFRLDARRRGKSPGDLLNDAYARKLPAPIKIYVPAGAPNSAFDHAADQLRRQASQASERRGTVADPATAEFVGGSSDGGISVVDPLRPSPHTVRRWEGEGKIGRHAADEEQRQLAHDLEDRQHHRFEGWKTLAQIARGRPHSESTYRNVLRRLVAGGEIETPREVYKGTKRFLLLNAHQERVLHDAVARIPVPEGPGSDGWILRELDGNPWIAERELLGRAKDEGYLGKDRNFYDRLRTIRLKIQRRRTGHRSG